MSKKHNIHQLGESLLLALKKGDPYINLSSALSEIAPEALAQELSADDDKKAFWINIYNAYFLILRKHQKVTKDQIYTRKLIQIAAREMSLDDIEHGILRKYRSKFSLGYLPNICAAGWIKRMAVSKIDYRIHFALNCGAASCPPIAFYHSLRIDKQLEMATYSFLESETKINHVAREVTVSKILLWYRGDFGGSKGSLKILSKYLSTDLMGYKIQYAQYDYTEHLDNFT